MAITNNHNSPLDLRFAHSSDSIDVHPMGRGKPQFSNFNFWRVGRVEVGRALNACHCWASLGFKIWLFRLCEILVLARSFALRKDYFWRFPCSRRFSFAARVSRNISVPSMTVCNSGCSTVPDRGARIECPASAMEQERFRSHRTGSCVFVCIRQSRCASC